MAPIGERNARAKYWGGREGEEGRGRRRGSRRGGCTRKTGVKSPQKFSTKPLIVLASGERGGKPRIYNVPMANSVPSLLLATLTHRLRIYSCRENSIAGKNHSLPRGGEISSLVSPFFSFLAAFCVARVCQSHDSTSIGPGIYIYMYMCKTSCRALPSLYHTSNQFDTRCNISRFRIYFARCRSNNWSRTYQIFPRSIQHGSVFRNFNRSLYYRKSWNRLARRQKNRKPRASNI